MKTKAKQVWEQTKEEFLHDVFKMPPQVVGKKRATVEQRQEGKRAKKSPAPL